MMQTETKSVDLTREAPIFPEVALHCTLRYPAGGSFHDVRDRGEISVPSSYRVLGKVFDAINSAPELEIRLPETMEEKSTLRVNMASKSEEEVLEGCLGAIDGWLVNIRTHNGQLIQLLFGTLRDDGGERAATVR
jgi:hypothetical protein